MRFLICSLSLAFLISGCTSVDDEAIQAVKSLRNGNDIVAVKWGNKLADDSSYSKNLGKVEAGRVALLMGNYNEAIRRFRSAVDSAVDRTESSPKLKMGDVFNTAISSTITDDRTREYYLPPYELNMALEYSILSYLFAGRRDEALVDARLSVYVQDTLAETLGGDLAKEPKEVSASARTIIDKQNQYLDTMIVSTRNSWENPVLWWLTGHLFEADGQYEMAWQSYRKAAAIQPACKFFAIDANRAKKDVKLKADKAKLIVIYEQDFVPMRESLKVPIPIYTGFAIDIPKYAEIVYVPQQVAVAGSSASMALDLRSLAARDLKEKMPGVVVRNITRAAVQATAQAAVNNSGNQYAQLGVFAGNMLISALRRADTRSWVTIPAMQHVWCSDLMEPGIHNIVLTINGAAITANVPLEAGETRLLWVSNAGSITRAASVSLSKNGAPTLDVSGKAIMQ